MNHGFFRIASVVLCLGVQLHPQALTAGRVRISEKVSKSLIISKVPPTYPEDARKKHIQGSVVVQAGISNEGTVEYLKVQSGDPMLSSAATEAVKKWKYKPLVLNGQVLPFETQVTLNFVLEGK